MLTKILTKYKLQENLNYEIQMSKKEFIDEMKKLIDEGYYSPLFAIFDVFNSNDKKFIGNISENGFLIRKRIGTFEFFPNTSKVKVKCAEKGGKLKLSTNIKGMGIISLSIKIFILIIYLILAFLLIIETVFSLGEANGLPALFAISIITVVIVYIPYLISRDNIKGMKIELEKLFIEIENNV